MKSNSFNQAGGFTRARLATILATLCGSTLAASAQPIFTQSFDNLGPYVAGQLGPAALVSQGWTFRVQSGNPSLDYGWRHLPYFPPGCGFMTFQPRAGNGYLISDSQSSWGPPIVISNWAILPVVSGQAAGQVISFWARRELDSATEAIEIRYSASGGTSTGSGPSAVGDFSQVLLSASSLSTANWSFYSATIPGNGRIAIRYVASGSIAGCGTDAAIDTLSIGPPAGPCATYPTIPSSGQTVTWTAPGGPYHICAQTIIPAGATVIVESGAEVFVDPGNALVVRGDLQVQAGARFDTRLDVNDPNAAQGSVEVYGTAELMGTASNPVRLTGNARGRGTFVTRERFGAMPGGKITASHVDLSTTISAIGSGVVIADHVVVMGVATGFNLNGFYTGRSSDISQLPGGTIAVRDSQFGPRTELYSQEGYVLVDNVQFDNATYEHQRVYAAQPVYLDHLNAQNNPNSPFVLRGFDFFFGANNVILNNGFPVRAEGAGITPGSTIPSSGNTTNRIHLGYGTPIREVTWCDAGVDYQIDTNPNGIVQNFAQIKILPGVTIKMGLNANFSSIGATLRMQGLADAPITIERLNPSQAWFSIWKAGGTYDLCKMEHVTLRGSTRGIDADSGSTVFLDSCLLENNQLGGFARNSASIYSHKTRYFGNNSGLVSSPGIGGVGVNRGAFYADGEGMPNWFEGNGFGIESQYTFANDPARGNYWGDPSGPTDPSNPGGTGDIAQGQNIVVPFVTAPPDMSDEQPVVRVRQHARLMEEGDKVILHWEASDDSAIDHFEIWLKPHQIESEKFLLEGNIPGNARSWEVVVPPMVLNSNFPSPNSFRVVAYDDAGQKSFDEFLFDTPYNPDIAFTGTVSVPEHVARPGELVEFCVDAQCSGDCTAGGSSEAFLELHGDIEIPVTLGPLTPCTLALQGMPPVSTDLARNVFVARGGGGRLSFLFSDFYSIRPDPLIGDAPPTVSLVAPIDAAYPGGTIVPISWNASDDESLRSFDIHASYNNGRTWHTIVDSLPGSARSFGWQLPPSTGISQVKVRVLARDLRFQVTSATSAAFAITPDDGIACDSIDFNNDGSFFDPQDIDAFLSVYSEGPCIPDTATCSDIDFNNDTSVFDPCDINAFFLVFSEGPCTPCGL